jgi:hypothetical protein
MKKMKKGVTTTSISGITMSLTKALSQLNDLEVSDIETVYIVDQTNTPITLEIIVGGENQTSDMTVRLDGGVIEKNLTGDFAERTLGSNREMNGKQLSIVATIADTSRTTNYTSLHIKLKGGFIDNNFLLPKTVKQEGDSADYLCLINFFKP